jgi:glutaminyl-peptide cyclotransferase
MTRLLTSLLLWATLSTTAFAVPVIPAEVVARYPHDPAAFTQGLLWHDGRLYESTGLYGRSSLREVELETGQIVRRHDLPRREFGEGITAVDGRIIQLTWRNGQAHVYDPHCLQRVDGFRYDGEGWGLTHDGASLVMSDGSDTLQFRDPDGFALQRSVRVTFEDEPLRMLNALQWVDGRIYANIWTTPYIAVIEPETGVTEALIDLTPLFTRLDRDPDLSYESPNGIAYDPERQRLFVTGKLWPWVFEIRVAR